MNNERPQPKFRKGEIVRHTQKHVEYVKSQVTNNNANTSTNWNKFPFGRVLIYTEPSWDSTFKEWSYDYEYGHCGLSEGHGLESTLEKCEPGFI